MVNRPHKSVSMSCIATLLVSDKSDGRLIELEVLAANDFVSIEPYGQNVQVS